MQLTSFLNTKYKTKVRKYTTEEIRNENIIQKQLILGRDNIILESYRKKAKDSSQPRILQVTMRLNKD